MKNKEKKLVSVLLNNDIFKIIKKLAYTDDVSISEEVRRLLEIALKKIKEDKQNG